MKPPDPGLGWRFLITDPGLVFGLFRLSISSRFSFGGLYVSRNLFLLRLSNFLEYNYLEYGPFCF